ncbi:MAG TPA: hypothetical protein VG269_20475 [Tepidisphaeraceae bacterium]|jgi:hypothetical protein|nr:hypothetical protein [Tepidisphaeraceae bacterium]
MSLLACGPTLPDLLWLLLRPLMFAFTIIAISCGALLSVTAYLDHAVKSPTPNNIAPAAPAAGKQSPLRAHSVLLRGSGQESGAEREVS